MDIPLKKCKECGRWLPATPEHFNKIIKKTTGVVYLRHDCKKCQYVKKVIKGYTRSKESLERHAAHERERRRNMSDEQRRANLIKRKLNRLKKSLHR